ncbi:MAG: hypothetical protein LUH07_06310 [Lachnospiraceae bacterium]|nr:hypothetical protein [Lachnospiraceae bacterium]
MLKRLEYILFIVCVIFLALCAPVFLFAVRDRISNQTVYAENQELTVSGVLTNNYIEDDAERLYEYLVSRESGGEYQVVELDSRLNTGEVLTLLKTAFHYDELSYGMIDGAVTTQANTQYAICSAQDASDILFLVTCVTLMQRGGDQDTDRLYRILVDSQTGALYFMSVYYGRTEDGANHKSFDEDIFSDSYGWAYEASMDEFFSEIDGLSGYTCYDLLLEFVDWYGSGGSFSGTSSVSVSESAVNMVTETANIARDSASDYGNRVTYDELVYYYADQAVDPADIDYSEATRTTLTMRFPSGGQTGDSSVTVEVITQFGSGDIITGGQTYECRLCMGIADFAVWIPRFGYIE